MLSTTAATAVGAQSQPKRPVVSKRLLSEAPDYASTSWADPWDFGQERDLTPIDNLTYKGFTNARVQGGRWKGTAAPQANIRLLQSWNSLAQGRDGEISPIDADTYTHISIRMRMTGFANAWGEVSWYDCGRLVQACRGAQGFRVLEGWQTYDFELVRDPVRGSVDWSGDIRGLVITPTARGGNIEIDWVRVYKPTNPPITVTARDADPSARLIWDRDRRAWNNNDTNPNWGVISEGRRPRHMEHRRDVPRSIFRVLRNRRRAFFGQRGDRQQTAPGSACCNPMRSAGSATTLPCGATHGTSPRQATYHYSAT